MVIYEGDIALFIDFFLILWNIIVLILTYKEDII